MQRIHDRGNIGKLILDVEKTPTPLVSQKQRDLFSSRSESSRCRHKVGEGAGGVDGSADRGPPARAGGGNQR